MANDAVARYVKKLAWLKAYKLANPCPCGETEPVCLSFHHRDPATKLFNVGKARKSIGMDKLEEEAAKCDVLCLNCHAKLHLKLKNTMAALEKSQATQASGGGGSSRR